MNGAHDRFWELAIQTASPTSQKHFIEAFTDYLNSVVSQANDRDNNTLCTVDTYLRMRRENIGARPSYVPGELHLNIPDEAFYHPIIKELEYHIAELIILDNASRSSLFSDMQKDSRRLFSSVQDITSFNKEQATGDDRHNILTIVMNQFAMDIDDAMIWVSDYHKEVEARFLDGLKRVPSFGPSIDKELDEYILHLANWPRCNDCWNFESGRYFGNKGREIQKSRLVPLLPKVKTDRSLKREKVVVPLVEI